MTGRDAAIVVLGVGAIAVLITGLGKGVAVVNTIAGYARNAGFTGLDLVTAVAVALAESGGDPNAYNPETAAGAPEGKGSYGLWQIYLNAHPEYEGVNLYDPQTNANAAFAIYRASGNTFRAWSTFKNGAYVAQLEAAQNQVSA